MVEKRNIRVLLALDLFNNYTHKLKRIDIFFANENEKD